MQPLLLLFLRLMMRLCPSQCYVLGPASAPKKSSRRFDPRSRSKLVVVLPLLGWLEIDAETLPTEFLARCGACHIERGSPPRSASGGQPDRQRVDRQ
ncbi:hypothetical protein C5Y97_00210 [Blastopirellula marina]|uniref:Uncharacterized protein n=1 Tax=Blastopirellula marina TaxID=124 RepID=A0A2S8GG21_9BACT|nr:hypothetical protein C5Y98_00210 [Blastopirellula marina]PTL46687.1 hypothetical protein C5Y97_00210 [Blastopirellula marina]